MDKEKILSASRSENRHGDEMQKLNNMKSAKAGLIGMTIVNFFILLYSYFLTGDNLITVICPIAAGLAVLFISEYKLNRKYPMLVLACVTSVIFIVTILLIISGFSLVHVYG